MALKTANYYVAQQQDFQISNITKNMVIN